MCVRIAVIIFNGYNIYKHTVLLKKRGVIYVSIAGIL